MNIDPHILTQILRSQTQQHTHKVIHRDQVRFIPGSQRCFNICKSTNVIHNTTEQRTKPSLIIISTYAGVFDKIQHPFTIKKKNTTLTSVGTEGTHLNIIKDIYDKPTTNIILNAESFLLKSGTSKDAHSHHFSSIHYCKSYLQQSDKRKYSNW